LIHLIIPVLALVLLAGAAQAQVLSLLGDSGTGVFAARKPLLVSVDPARSTAGLFVGRAEGGMFADLPAHEPAFADAPVTGLRGSDVEVIRALIQEAESRRNGYDAVQHGARIKPAKRPTQMTLAEIFAWIKATPGQPHAIGRYQFIPATLRRVVERTGMSMHQRFDAEAQDRLADVLLAEAGLAHFRSGQLSRKDFMNNLAKIWAGFPNSTGKSHYDGYAGNKASMSWARFDAAMARIMPGRG
jgi:muramidase (phage lysozyme)